MQCNKCEGRVFVRHTFVVGDIKTQDAQCAACRKRFTLVTRMEDYTGIGTGARARAKVLGKESQHDESA